MPRVEPGSPRLPTIKPILSGPRSPDAWISADKFDHLLLSAMLSSAGYLALKVQRNEPGAAFVYSVGISFGAGLGKEIFDTFFPGHPSLKDLTADLLGATLGALVVSGL